MAALTYIRGFREADDQEARLAAWRSFCRILLASDDYIYVD